MKILTKCLLILVTTLLCCNSELNALPTYSNQLNMLLGKISSFKNAIQHETKTEEAKFDYAIQHENKIVRTGLNGIPDHEDEVEIPKTGRKKVPTPVEVTNGNRTENPIYNNDILHHMDPKKPQEEVPMTGLFFIKHMTSFLQIKQFLSFSGKKIFSFAECMTCRFAVAFFQNYVNTGATEDDIGAIAYKVCTTFKIETPRVCSGVSKLFKRELTQVIMKVALSPSEVCGFLYRECGTSVNPFRNWTVPLTPFPKPSNVSPKPPREGAPVLRVLHISDVHIDPYYAEGSDASCGEPLCCREASGKPAIPADAAGHWGDYRNCDIPLRTLENMLEHVNKTHKLDYVIWTGDIPPHDIWNNSRKEAVDLLHLASKVIHKHLGNIPIFPALGNHESSPVNSFPVPQIVGNDSISWLYDEVAKAWSVWLPNSIDTLKLGAYYSVPVYPGFRIISLNMNYCNSLNWWLLMNSTDPTGQLAWLVAQLQMAEDKNEKVHIIGHIPPGEPDCLGVWSRNYYRIVNRYEATITGQFFGHTHNDEFEVFYDKTGAKPRATNVAYIGPSVTTFDGVNPGYRIYTVDGNYPKSSFVILDSETYFTNLTDANMSPEPTWQFEYSARKEYNMASLLPEEWDKLVQRFEVDEELFMKFNRYFYKLSDAASSHCDDGCKKRMICRLRRAQSNDPLFCV